MPIAHAPRQVLPPVYEGPWLAAASRGFGIWMAWAVVALAILVGLAIPDWISPDFLAEGGFVERATIWIYGAAVACTLALRWPGMSRRDMAAAGLLLLAMAAREADLHKAMFGTSILKSRFYLNADELLPVLGALAVLLPIVLAGLWLLARHGRRWLRAPSQWTAPMVSVTTLAVAMVFAKIMDRTPDTLDQLGLLEQTSQTVLYVMLSLEEVLEFALPLFAITALVQCRLLGRRPPRVET